MAIKTIDDQHLVAIGEAIRSKNGAAANYKPSEMADAILALPSGNLMCNPYQIGGQHNSKSNSPATIDLSQWIGTSNYLPFGFSIECIYPDVNNYSFFYNGENVVSNMSYFTYSLNQGVLTFSTTEASVSFKVFNLFYIGGNN